MAVDPLGERLRAADRAALRPPTVPQADWAGLARRRRRRGLAVAGGVTLGLLLAGLALAPLPHALPPDAVVGRAAEAVVGRAAEAAASAPHAAELLRLRRRLTSLAARIEALPDLPPPAAPAATDDTRQRHAAVLLFRYRRLRRAHDPAAADLAETLRRDHADLIDKAMP